MSNGYLIVRVSAASGTIPLEGALVTVYYAENDRNGVIITRYTDQSGKSEKIELPAPERSLSQTPESGGVRPYSVYNVEVVLDGYYDAFELEVPVFDGVTSVLPVNMIPKAEYNAEEDRPRTGIINVDREPPLGIGG